MHTEKVFWPRKQSGHYGVGKYFGLCPELELFSGGARQFASLQRHICSEACSCLKYCVTLRHQLAHRPTSVEEARVVICLNSKSDISFVLIFRGVIRARCQHRQPSDPRATCQFKFERQISYHHHIRLTDIH